MVCFHNFLLLSLEILISLPQMWLKSVTTCNLLNDNFNKKLKICFWQRRCENEATDECKSGLFADCNWETSYFCFCRQRREICFVLMENWNIWISCAFLSVKFSWKKVFLSSFCLATQSLVVLCVNRIILSKGNFLCWLCDKERIKKLLWKVSVRRLFVACTLS